MAAFDEILDIKLAAMDQIDPGQVVDAGARYEVADSPDGSPVVTAVLVATHEHADEGSSQSHRIVRSMRRSRKWVAHEMHGS